MSTELNGEKIIETRVAADGELPEGFAGLSEHDLGARFATISEIQEAARAALDSHVWDFLDGGSGDEVTLLDNRAAFTSWKFRPKLLTGIAEPTTNTTFLGLPLSLPVLSAPFGADRLFDPEGHRAVARANQRAGTWSIVPEASSFSLEAVAKAAPEAARMFQLHPMGTDTDVLRMARRAADAGYSALCLTCDCPAGGWRERNRRNRYGPRHDLVTGNYTAHGAEFAGHFLNPQRQWTWNRVADVLAQAELPFMAKGILTAEEARAAVSAGASAILVSNHGGRQLDGAPASLDQLPEIVAEVGAEVDIALDSGIRRGADIVKALALGADVVVLGRPIAMALAAGGQNGVLRMLELLRDEMVNVMTLLGRPDVVSLDGSALQPAVRRG
ncbi:alpha-hydroxy-acid oxidizing protein [Amycolatopsis sp. K13G38]|uniref:Alpha-hydroxy-acid oxidizing protein n=1 Tax=Amycolatopsis acididurans TaxID=2724524 RepID=A0ABX1J8J4_9PSEU|nr:alpha-hydroxy acid oxidase [Amycolatopsis acididurans]NKQ56083.1 alpha-hydroxy-acid oxidizing protein [Amycolatopsis acididurans]